MAKRVLCVILALLIPFALFPVSAFASYSPTTGEDFVVVVSELYGAYNNVTSATYSNGPTTTQIISGATDYVVYLYNQYASSASDPVTAAALGAALLAAGTLAVIYDAVTGTGKVSLYMDQYVSSMDGYWDYALNDLGLHRYSDGFYHYAEEAGLLVPIDFVSAPWFMPIISNSSLSQSYLTNNGTICFGSSGASIFYAGSTYTNTYVGLYLASPSATKYNVIFISDGSKLGSQSYDVRYTYTSFSSPTSLYMNSVTPSRYCTIGNYVDVSSSTINPLIPKFSSLQDALDAFNGYNSDAWGLTLEPSDYIDDSLSDPSKILIPNTSSPDYSPKSVIIDTDIDWIDSWGTVAANPTPGVYYRVTDSTVQDRAVPDILDAIMNDEVSVKAPTDSSDPSDPSDSSNPSEVFVPLLPVTLPDFNFNLSGIWYYVVQWVQSIGSWLSLMFQVWASLPAAFVYPVYATAVIVIVLGVYKRFFM